VRKAIARIRTEGANRVTDPLPQEVQPMVEELNALLAHSDKQAEEARTHAGNLAHALKTPLTVLTNAASAHAPDLDETVLREAALMRRQVDHHLARARAVGRRAFGHSRTGVMEAVEAVERAVARLHPQVRFDTAGAPDALVGMERQDLDEILGNLIENAAKYGGGSVFVTVDPDPAARLCEVWIEDDGAGISESDRAQLFGARSDGPIRQPQVGAPRRAEHRARRLGLGEPLGHGAVAAHLAGGQVAQTDAVPQAYVLGHGAADADLDVVGMRAEHEQIHRTGGSAHRVHPNTSSLLSGSSCSARTRIRAARNAPVSESSAPPNAKRCRG